MISVSCIVAIMLAWNFLGFVAITIIPYSRDANEICEIFNPSEIYKLLSVNKFGCAMVTIFFNLLCPIFAIGYWFYWLCTVGRNKE